jgi:hypothetical protein
VRQLAGEKGNIVHYMGGELRAKDGMLVHWCTERNNTRRGSEGPGLALFNWRAHRIFAGEGGFGYVTVAVSWQDV